MWSDCNVHRLVELDLDYVRLRTGFGEEDCAVVQVRRIFVRV